jgi:hypothetical protein
LTNGLEVGKVACLAGQAAQDWCHLSMAWD